MRIALCSAEVFPFAKTGGLADVCGTLPYALAAEGVNVDIIMPHYSCVEGKGIELVKCQNLNAHVAHLNDKIRIFFIDHSGYFNRTGLYGDSNGDYQDNLDRFKYFCYEALELLEEVPDKYDAIHCHDWQTGLIPTILKNKPFDYQKLRKTKCVFTIHNLAYQGVFPKEMFHKLKLPDDVYSSKGIEFYHQICFMKGGLVYSDEITTVSPRYAREIKTKRYGCGLEGVLSKFQIHGVLNGLDYDHWNPETDKFIPANYGKKSRSKKAELKESLQKTLGLALEKDTPIFGFIGRLSHQKGLELIEKSINELVVQDIQLVFVGTGEKRYEDLLTGLVKNHPGKVAAHVNFNEEIAHLTYAGSDFLLMPSVYEPCGLTQMIALAYGTIPVVSATGGLVDTIEPYDKQRKSGNGFIFTKYDVHGLVGAIDKALVIYQDTKRFDDLVAHAFSYKFTWQNAAKRYISIYKS